MSGTVEILWDEETGGYEWDAFYVYRHPNFGGMFFVTDTQSGCSCYGYEELSAEELRNNRPMSKHEVIKDYQAWCEYDVANLERLIGALSK